MKSLFDSAHLAALERRLEALSPDARGRWGRMRPGQAVCHLADSFGAVLGDRALAPVDAPWYLSSSVVRFAALTLPIPWPKGAPTAPEMDQEVGGTPPGDFHLDVARLKGLMQRFAGTGGEGLEPHILFGELSPAEWGRWGWRHVDHHLRQFGA